LILTWLDHDGDPVAVESASIVGLSVGSLNGPRAAEVRVTLIWAAGVGQPFMVPAPFADVLQAWTDARTSGGTPERPGFHGWPVNWWEPHPSSLLPGAPAWAAKGGV
jgi:hypothetical protein